MNVTGIVWMGVRSAAYPQLRELFGSIMGLEITRDSNGATWFALPGGDEIQIYDGADADHAFFGPGPVVGFEVEDMKEALTELDSAGVELVGAGDASGTRRWQHFRGPDGNIYEIIGPLDRSETVDEGRTENDESDGERHE